MALTSEFPTPLSTPQMVLRIKRCSHVAGFTLVELLCVIAILAILATVIIPSLPSLLTSNSLTQASLTVADIFSFARQSAIAQNKLIEVRIYQYADPTFSGETAGNAASGKYRAFQVFAISDSSAATAIGKMERLPSGIIIDSNTAISSLLSPTLIKSNWSATDPQISLPGIGTNYNCCAFSLRADGSTSLSSTLPVPPGTWCLTLHSISLGDNLATPPANFATVQIEPISGKVTTFHP